MWDQKKKKMSSWYLVVARGKGRGVGKMGEGDQKE